MVIGLYPVGMIPSSVCGMPSLGDFEVTKTSTNPGITCAPVCLSSVAITDVPTTTCPTGQDYGLCGFIAATNIVNIVGHSVWTCTTLGTTSTNPCSPVWGGLNCDGYGNVIGIVLGGINVVGNYNDSFCFK